MASRRTASVGTITMVAIPSRRSSGVRVRTRREHGNPLQGERWCSVITLGRAGQ